MFDNVIEGLYTFGYNNPDVGSVLLVLGLVAFTIILTIIFNEAGRCD